MDFSETVVVYCLKLATDDRSDKKFLLTSKLCPLGLYAPAPGLYTCIKSWKKNCIKSDFKDIFFKLATNEWSDKTFLLTSKLCPLRAGCLCPGAIYMCKIMKKKCIKSDFKEKILKLATNYRSDKMFLLTSKFRPQGVVSPCPGAIVMRPSCWHQNFGPNGLSAPYPWVMFKLLFSLIFDFNISSALRWAIQDQWSSGFYLFIESCFLLCE